MEQPAVSSHILKLGLGDAVERFMNLHLVLRAVSGSELSMPLLHGEYDMLKEWLNESLELDAGLNCKPEEEDDEPAQDTVMIFKKSIETGCCRNEVKRSKSRSSRRTSSRDSG